MFHSEKKFVPELDRTRKFLIDVDRGLSFRTVAGATPERDACYLLTWVGGRVAVEARRERQADPMTGDTFYLTEITHVGRSSIAVLYEGLEPDYGTPPVASEQVEAWAAEALLAYGGAGNDLSRADGYNRIILDGREMRLSDFGPYFIAQVHA